MNIIAHRGASGHEPENSLAAIRKAYELSAKTIEVDVRKCRDKLVLMHDPKIDRTTNGKGFVSRFKFSNLCKFKLANDEKIPTLEDAITIIKNNGNDTILRIHVKTPGAVPETLDTIKKHGIWENVILVSRVPIVREIRKRDKNVKVGVTGKKQSLSAAKELGAFEVSPHIEFVNEKFVEEAKDMGLRVYTWTVNDLESAKRAFEVGVDGIITDYPDLLNEFRGPTRKMEGA